jgi:long-chain acyl-CoA synthetase
MWLLLSALLASSAFAAEVVGVKLDDKATLGGQELVLNGAGVRTKVVFKVYVAGLYLPQKQTTTQGVLAKNAPRRVQLTLLRDLSSEQLLEALHTGLTDNNTPAELEAIKKEVDQLTAIFGALKEAKKGGVINLDYTPEGGTKISLNGAERGAIAGEAFNRALLKVWLGDKPVQADLKKALLGG